MLWKLVFLRGLMATSYDLDQDTKLAEETTVLVESYTVSPGVSHPYSC